MAPAHRALLGLLCFVLLAAPGRSLAQETTPDDEYTPPEAVEYFRVARERYEAGQYREAAEALERALVLDPESPTLVFNLARVYELLGELDRSLQYYEQYQRLLPQQQAREQERAEATIRRLQGARASDELEREPPQQVEALRQLPGLVLVRESGVADLGFWLTLGVGAASLATGAVFGGLMLDARTSANSFPNAEPFGVVADITLVAGTGLVLTAVLLYFLREHTVERAPIREAGEGEGEETAVLPILEVGERQATVGVAAWF